MPLPEPVHLPDPERGAAVYADDRSHVFHSWSAQAAISPMPVARTEGLLANSAAIAANA